MRVFANTLREIMTTFNVLAETHRRNDDNVVMAGAHLDSVLAGPGINDNGSGSAAILEIADADGEGEADQHRALRLVGRRGVGPGRLDELRQRPQPRRSRTEIALYLNFDMIGSPNYVRFVYDGDGRRFGPGRSRRVRPPSRTSSSRFYTRRG